MPPWSCALTFEEARRRFPVLGRLAYLNAGTCGPLSRSTLEAMQARLTQDAELGRGGPPYFGEMLARRQRVRSLLAAELGVEAERVALTNSTTEACNIVLSGLGLGPEDEVVTTDVEHFGLLGPLHTSGARVRVARVRDRLASGALDTILAETGPRTKLVATSHVSWSTGHALPVAELKERLPVPILVDGAQSVGAIPVDARAFDFYTVSGQKWLCGPDATGALFVAEPDGLRVTRPTNLSQRSYDESGSFEPQAGAARFDSGWIPLASLAGLEAALTGVPEWRFERARETTERCRELLARGFELVTEPGHATLVSFRVEGDAAAIAAQAFERGVVIRDLPKLGWLRASCGYWTSEEDLQRLVDAVKPQS